MRSFFLLCCAAGLLLALTACGSGDDRSVDPSQSTTSSQSGTDYQTNPLPAPDVTLETMNGRTLNLAEQQGKVILVNFWATWCGPCRREIPDLIELYSDLRSEGLVIMGIAVDQEGAEVVKPFVEKREINYPIVLDPDQSTESHFEAMYGLPTTYVVNPDGQIVRRVLGVFPIEEMKPQLKKMLDESGA